MSKWNVYDLTARNRWDRSSGFYGGGNAIENYFSYSWKETRWTKGWPRWVNRKGLLVVRAPCSLSLSLSLFFSFSLSLSLRRNQMTEVADRKYFIMCHVLFAPRNALSMKINFIKRLSHWTIACARPSIERVCKCIVELQLIIEEFKAMSYIFFFFSFELDLFLFLKIPTAYDIFRLILKKPNCLISLLSKEGGLRYRSWNVNDVSFSHEHLKFHAANLLRVTDLHWLAS